MKDYKVVPREDNENESYKRLIKEAYSRIDEAIHHITYANRFIDDNNFKLNELIIKQLEDMTYTLEDLEDAIIYKPIKMEE